MSEHDDFIDDGYTRHVTLKAERGHHGEVTLSYRPMTQPEFAKVSHRIDIYKARATEEAAEEAEVYVAGKVSEHLIEWSYKREISPENLKRANPVLLYKLFRLVSCRHRETDGFEWAEATKN